MVKSTEELLGAGKLLLFDLETTSLEANRGHILCASAAWVNDDYIYSWRIDATPGYGTTPESFRDDSQIVKELVELCTQADAVIAYYGDYGRFDVPYLNTRAIANGLDPCPPLTVIDPHRTARRSLRLGRNSMAAVAEILGTEHQKGHVPLEYWMAAQYGDSKAISMLVEYCEQDVLVLEDIYLKLRPLIKNHPNIAPIIALDDKHVQCTTCGSTKTEGHGHRRTKNFIIHRRRCKNCGSVYEGQRKKL